MTRKPGVLVPGGAILAGAVADAMFVLNADEHARRVALGLGPVVSLEPLFLQLDRDENRPGATGMADRELAIPGRVTAVEIRGWRRPQSAFDRALIFAPAVPVRLVATAAYPRLSELVLHASALGIGVTVQEGRLVEELVAPHVPRGIFDAATWGLYERAYGRWLTEQEQGHPRTSTQARRGRSAA